MTARTSPAEDADDLLSVRLTRVLPAPRERVFQAWTSPEMLPRWWGPAGFRGTSAEADPRPGGAFAVEMTGPDGAVHRMSGIYTELAAPSLVCLEIRHRLIPGAAERPEGYIPTHVRVELNEHGRGTELVLTHSGFLDATLAGQFKGGWNGSLDKLETALAG